MGSRISTIIRWMVRIAIFILILVLIVNNLQKVQFNFYGVYTWNLPLIVIVLIAMAIGIAIGLIFGFIRSLELRSRIKLLHKDLELAKKSNIVSNS